MEFTETTLKGACVVRLRKIEDDRGYFARAWCRDEFLQQGLNPAMVQLNVGFSHRRGTVRGMHYQLAPHAEAKFIRCTRGAIYDVIIDLREGSPTIGRWYGIELRLKRLNALCAGRVRPWLSDFSGDTEMYYLTSSPYAPAAARGVRYDDPTFGSSGRCPSHSSRRLIGGGRISPSSFCPLESVGTSICLCYPNKKRVKYESGPILWWSRHAHAGSEARSRWWRSVTGRYSGMC